MASSIVRGATDCKLPLVLVCEGYAWTPAHPRHEDVGDMVDDSSLFLCLRELPQRDQHVCCSVHSSYETIGPSASVSGEILDVCARGGSSSQGQPSRMDT